MSLFKFNEIYNNIIKEGNESDIQEKYVLHFSNNIASELTQTLNKFSEVGAEMISSQDVEKETLDNFLDLHAKIKDLIDVATIK